MGINAFTALKTHHVETSLPWRKNAFGVQERQFDATERRSGPAEYNGQ